MEVTSKQLQIEGPNRGGVGQPATSEFLSFNELSRFGVLINVGNCSQVRIQSYLRESCWQS